MIIPSHIFNISLQLSSLFYSENSEGSNGQMTKEQHVAAGSAPDADSYQAPVTGDKADATQNKKGETANTEADKATKELDQKVKAIEGELEKTLQDQQKESVSGSKY